ncbi:MULTISPECIES: lipoprotein [Bacteroidales]|uniref:lipoprotein n=1 Tax=Bacteroidales TaxID=171549 RepID=UPI00242ECAB2|nr:MULTISPECIES: lipoprotein [Bacteroidales]
MKKYIITLALATALLTGCTSNKVALENLRGEISWNAFCDARGYDRTDNTYTAVNEYLDTWCGSVDEEAALIEAGVEPY